MRKAAITLQVTKYRTNGCNNSSEYDNKKHCIINQSYLSLRYLLHPGYEQSTISRKREISYDILCAVHDIFGGQVPDEVHVAPQSHINASSISATDLVLTNALCARPMI